MLFDKATVFCLPLRIFGFWHNRPPIPICSCFWRLLLPQPPFTGPFGYNVCTQRCIILRRNLKFAHESRTDGEGKHAQPQNKSATFFSSHVTANLGHFLTPTPLLVGRNTWKPPFRMSSLSSARTQKSERWNQEKAVHCRPTDLATLACLHTELVCTTPVQGDPSSWLLACFVLVWGVYTVMELLSTKASNHPDGSPCTIIGEAGQGVFLPFTGATSAKILKDTILVTLENGCCMSDELKSPVELLKVTPMTQLWEQGSKLSIRNRQHNEHAQLHTDT